MIGFLPRACHWAMDLLGFQPVIISLFFRQNDIRTYFLTYVLLKLRFHFGGRMTDIRCFYYKNTHCEWLRFINFVHEPTESLGKD